MEVRGNGKYLPAVIPRFLAGIRDEQYRWSRENDFGSFSVIACLVTAAFVALGILWDYAIAPQAAREVIGVRLAEAASLLVLALLFWRRPGSYLALGGFIAVALFIEITFLEILSRFGERSTIGIGAFLYFFVFVPFIGRAFGLLANISVLLLIALLPNVLYLAGLSTIDIKVFNAYVALAFFPVIMMLVALEFMHWRMHVYRCRLAHHAQHDELTGLPNRRHFMDLAQRLHAAAPRQEAPVSVLYMDLDRFKDINDRHGHDTGDNVLQNVARVLEENLRRSDVVARHGGEEFVAWLHDTDADTAYRIAARIRNAVASISLPVNGGSDEIRLTISIGVTTCAKPVHAPGLLEELLTHADRALYRAKEQGRNRIESSSLTTEGI